MTNNINEQIVFELISKKIDSKKDLMLAKRNIAKKYGIEIFSNSEILKNYNTLISKKKLEENKHLKNILRKRAIRTMSGIAPVAVLTRPYECPGNCAFCPTEEDVPQSYLSNEPAVMRAIRCNYDPFTQVQDRLKALVANGHTPTKIELIVIGGTWSVLPKKYKYWYILNCFAAANQFRNKSLETKNQKYSINTPLKILKETLLKEQKKNENTKYQIIGLTLETRPDYIDEKELVEMRKLGCTRVELGVQAIDDEILKLNKRGHGVERVTEATELLRTYGFKTTYHLMPGLPGSSAKKDLVMFKQLFSDSRFQPDQIKFYPTVVTRGSLLYDWWKQGKYKPYSDKTLQDLIIKCKEIVPPYVRIIRLIRDIPGESIIAGNKVTNLRQIMQDRGTKCNCIRCREPREAQIKNYELRVTNYKANPGEEYFISFESKDNLYGFCRLHIYGDATAMIRELHVYGQLVAIGENKKTQHAGFGKKLVKEAEKIAKGRGAKKMSIISGVGVRNYYRKLGYRLNNTYMTKSL